MMPAKVPRNNVSNFSIEQQMHYDFIKPKSMNTTIAPHNIRCMKGKLQWDKCIDKLEEQKYSEV